MIILGSLKARSGLPVSVNWIFLLGVTAEALRANIGWKSAISLQRGSVDPKFQVEGVAPTNHSSSQKTRLNDISYDIKIWTDLSSILSQITRLTDGRTDRQTDRILIARPRLHSMQRGKNMTNIYCAIAWKRYEIGCKWVLFARHRKWHRVHGLSIGTEIGDLGWPWTALFSDKRRLIPAT